MVVIELLENNDLFLRSEHSMKLNQTTTTTRTTTRSLALFPVSFSPFSPSLSFSLCWRKRNMFAIIVLLREQSNNFPQQISANCSLTYFARTWGNSPRSDRSIEIRSGELSFYFANPIKNLLERCLIWLLAELNWAELNSTQQNWHSQLMQSVESGQTDCWWS